MVGFIGFGRMGSALAKGAVASRVLKVSQIVVFDSDEKSRAAAKKLGFRVAKNSADVVAKSSIIFLCVKPQNMRDALTPVVLESGQLHLIKKCFVSIAAGLPVARFQNWLGHGVSIFRVMPNTPALLGAGISAVSRGRFGTVAQQRQINKILSSVSQVVSVPERLMDAVTAVSGSGPAYVFYLAEAMIVAAQRLGMSLELARQLVHQTVFGSGKMLALRSEPAEELRRQVTSPGGTTAAAIDVFEKKNLKKVVQEALRRAAQRSAELSKS